jgi:MFS transporter, DHA2 family, methylenomycin A resistance protein
MSNVPTTADRGTVTETNPDRTSDTDLDREAVGARITLLLASAGFFLITLDILIVNVALTQIERELGGGTVGQQWVVDGYTCAFASLLLFAGNLADRIGAKRAFGIGVALFGLTSIACALAPTIGALIAARAGQGAAAAIMLPASMALIRETFPNPGRRARALGVWAVGGAVAAALGPLLGGVLTTFDWRWVFGINIPVCVAMLALLVKVATSSTRPAPFDWAGQILGVLALAGLTFGLIEGGAYGFGSLLVIITLALAVASLLAFVIVESRVARPMMPMELFDSSGMRIAVAIGFAFMVGWYGTVFVGSIYLQQQLGLPPLFAGLAFLPSALFAVVGNLISGPVTIRYGTRVPIVAGLSSMVVGLVGFVLTAPLGSPLVTTLLIIPIGAGGSLAVPPTTGLVLASVAPERAGTASAVFNTFRQVGGAVAIAIFGALIADRTQFIAGLQTSLTIAAVLLLATVVTSLRIRPSITGDNQRQTHRGERTCKSAPSAAAV